jgi:CheY-like chemotaxis protein
MFFDLNWPDLPFDLLKKRTRILIIDDENFEYMPLLQKDGYSIDKWNDLVDEKVTELENGLYDIILLDIQGVGKDFSRNQGLGILMHLKKINPAQIIVAYSNSDYNLKYQDFFKLANDVIEKSQEYFHFKEIIDKNIKLRFSYEYYLTLILGKLDKSTDNKKINTLIRKSIKHNRSVIINKYLNSNNIDKETITFIINIISSAIQIYASLQGMRAT